jgi:hypothetical protein
MKTIKKRIGSIDYFAAIATKSGIKVGCQRFTKTQIFKLKKWLDESKASDYYPLRLSKHKEARRYNFYRFKVHHSTGYGYFKVSEAKKLIANYEKFLKSS